MDIGVCEATWLEIAAELRERLGSDRYDRWLAPLSVLSAQAGELRLGAPNRFWQEWIEDKYLETIGAALHARLGSPIRVTLGIDPRLFRRLRKEQRAVLEGMPCADNPGVEPFAPSPRGGAGKPADKSEAASGREQGAGGEQAAGAEQTLESFIVGDSNRLAHAAAMQVVASPGRVYNPLFVYGKCGLGKTHLLRAISHGLRGRHPRLTVRYLTGEEFLNQFITSLRGGTIERFRDVNRRPQVLVVDDIHLLGNKLRTQEEFLHTFNALVDAGHQIVMASDGHPRSIENLQKPLLGRFISGLVVTIGRPDFATRFEILRRRASQSPSPLGEDVLQAIAESVPGNVRDLIGAFNLLQAMAEHECRPLDLAAARRALAECASHESHRHNLAGIARKVAQHYSVTVEAMVSGCRVRSLALARQVAMFLARKYTGRSLAEIGKFFGDRNHTSVKSAVEKVGRLLPTNPALAKDLEKIIDSFED